MSHLEKQASLSKPDQAFLHCVLKRRCGGEHSANVSVIFCLDSLSSVGLISFSTPGPKLIQFRAPASVPTFVSVKGRLIRLKSCSQI